MPLGKISKNMITSAYEVLSKAMDLVTNGGEGSNQGQIIALSNQFFTLVPHDFGTGNAPLLNNKDVRSPNCRLRDMVLRGDTRSNANAGFRNGSSAYSFESGDVRYASRYGDCDDAVEDWRRSERRRSHRCALYIAEHQDGGG